MHSAQRRSRYTGELNPKPSYRGCSWEQVSLRMKVRKPRAKKANGPSLRHSAAKVSDREKLLRKGAIRSAASEETVVGMLPKDLGQNQQQPDQPGHGFKPPEKQLQPGRLLHHTLLY